MSTPNPAMTEEVEAITRAYAALNRNDIDGFTAMFDPHIERVEPPDFPLGGTYRGLDAVKAHIAQGRGTWAEGACEPQRFITIGDRIVVVLIRVRVRLRRETEWREGSIADVFAFRNGRAVQFRTFADEQQALEWADTPAAAPE